MLIAAATIGIITKRILLLDGNSGITLGFPNPEMAMCIVVFGCMSNATCQYPSESLLRTKSIIFPSAITENFSSPVSSGNMKFTNPESGNGYLTVAVILCVASSYLVSTTEPEVRYVKLYGLPSLIIDTGMVGSSPTTKQL